MRGGGTGLTLAASRVAQLLGISNTKALRPQTSVSYHPTSLMLKPSSPGDSAAHAQVGDGGGEAAPELALTAAEEAELLQPRQHSQVRAQVLREGQRQRVQRRQRAAAVLACRARNWVRVTVGTVYRPHL